MQFLVALVFLGLVFGCSGQMMDPAYMNMLYGGGMSLYGGLNPYYYNGMGNYGAYNSPMMNPYMDQTAAMMYGNYNGLNSLGGLGTGGLPNGLNNGMGNFGNNGMLGSNGMLGGGGGNMFAPSFGGLNALIGGRNFRNRIGYSRDSGNSRLQSNSMLDCGLLNPRPCGNDVQKLRTVGAGTAWENSHDSRRR